MVAPILRLNGRKLGTRPIRGAGHVAVSRLRIEWGRSSLLEQQRPGLAIIDTVTRGSDPIPPRKGDKLTIEHPTRGFLFRGTVASAPTTRRELRFPSGLVESVTLTTVTAHDPLTMLGKVIPTGPSVYRQGHGDYAAVGGWNAQGPGARTTAVATALNGAYVTTIEEPPNYVATGPDIIATLAPEKPSSTSALLLLLDAYSHGGILSTCAYDATDDSIRHVTHAPATAAVITLTQGSGGTLSITPAAGTGVLPARLARMASRSLEDPAEAVALARQEGVYYRSWLEFEGTSSTRRHEYTGTATSGPVDGTREGATYGHPAPYYMSYDWSSNTDEASKARMRYAAWWVEQTRTAFAALNGLSRIPALTIDPEHPDLAGFAQGFRTRQLGAFYLAGSMFNGRRDVPSVVQFIGGTLTYDERGRWRHTLTPTATRAGAGTPLTLAQMFPPTSADRFDKWPDTLTLNDLAAVTRRTP